jgi:hypothetical protein
MMAIPEFEKLLVEHPLYEPIELKPADDDAVYRLLSAHMRFDCYCPTCRQDRTFSTLRAGLPSTGLMGGIAKVSDIRDENHAQIVKGMTVSGSPKWLLNADLSLTAYCTRHESHVAVFHFSIRNVHLIKVGQFPSLADIAGGEIRKYRKVLGASRAAELHKAIGLAAHGVGIGSFVYLRRIFESLLQEHKDDAARRGIQILEYERMRVSERIDALRSTLPEFLVENKAIYGIMSAGLHNLSEERCLAVFPVLKDSIILILQQDAERLERLEREEQLAKAIGNAASALKE